MQKNDGEDKINIYHTLFAGHRRSSHINANGRTMIASVSSDKKLNYICS